MAASFVDERGGPAGRDVDHVAWLGEAGARGHGFERQAVDAPRAAQLRVTHLVGADHDRRPGGRGRRELLQRKSNPGTIIGHLADAAIERDGVGTRVITGDDIDAGEDIDVRRALGECALELPYARETIAARGDARRSGQ